MLFVPAPITFAFVRMQKYPLSSTIEKIILDFFVRIYPKSATDTCQRHFLNGTETGHFESSSLSSEDLFRQ